MRIDLRSILRDPAKRRRLLVSACLALQHREGIDTTQAQMERAFDKVLKGNQPGEHTDDYTD